MSKHVLFCNFDSIYINCAALINKSLINIAPSKNRAYESGILRQRFNRIEAIRLKKKVKTTERRCKKIGEMSSSVNIITNKR